MTVKRLECMLAALLFVATLGLYWPVVHYGFVNFDDGLYLLNNEHVRSGLTWKNFLWAFNVQEEYWIPVTRVVRMAVCDLFGLDARWHHAVNMLLHAANTLLLYGLFKRMTGAAGRSAFVAALFALHPLHVESVAWVTELKDVLSTFFWLLALEAYIAYARSGSRRVYAMTMILFLLGLMSKPMLISFPFVLFLLDYWPLRRWRNIPAKRLVLEKAPFLLAAGLSAGGAFLILKAGNHVSLMQGIPWEYRLGNALMAYCAYIRKMFWPFDLSVFYPYVWDRITVANAAASAALLSAISAMVFARRKKNPYGVTGWLWFLLALIPVIGILSGGRQAMADRYTYVPLIGLFIMVAWGAWDVFRHWRLPVWVGALLGCVTLALTVVQSRIQLGYWEDDAKLFGQAVRVTTDNPIAQHLLGVELVKRDQYEQAIGHYLEAIYLDPDDPAKHSNLAFAYAGMGRYQDAQHAYEHALRLKPRDPDMLNNLGIALAKQGKIDEAIHQYDAALKIDPSYEKARYNLQVARERQGGDTAEHLQERKFGEAVALARQDKLSEAIAAFENFLGQWPEFAPAHYNLGVLLSRTGDVEAAKARIRAALRLQPDMQEAAEAMKSLSANQL